MDQRTVEYERMRELLHTTEEVLRNERETKTLALDELASLRARIAAAVAECEGILRHTVTLAVDDAHTRGYVAGMAQAARDIRAKLEGR